MNVTITFRKDTKADHKGRRNIFESKKEIQKYFFKLHKKKGNNGFFFFKRMHNKKPIKIKINAGDKLYFLFEKEVIATAIYTGICIGEDRIDENGKKHKVKGSKNKFTFGYKIEKIRLLCPPVKLKNTLPNKRNSTNYITEEYQLLNKELESLL